MSFINTQLLRRLGRGFSLVEIMVAMVIGMVGILIIMQVFLVAEKQKRTTTSGADAQGNALMALYTMEQDLLMAGLGVVGLDCTVIKAAYDGGGATVTYDINAMPVTITQNSPAAGSDRIAIVFSNSAFGNIPTTITEAMPAASSELKVVNGESIVDGDLFILSEPGKDCTLAQATHDGQKTGRIWHIQMNPSSPYNEPGRGIMPAGGYGVGTKLLNMGSMVNREYYVANNNLMIRDANLPESTPLALVSGIFAIKAQYGRDTGTDGYADVFDNTAPNSAAKLVAIRLATVARSGLREKDLVSTSPLVLWDGGTIDNGGAIELDEEARHYRYKIYQTTIPLRNVIWNH